MAHNSRNAETLNNMGQTKNTFLTDQAKFNALLLLNTITYLGQQKYKAQIEKIYSTNNKLTQKINVGKTIEFMGCGNSWGREILQTGDRAFIFISTICDTFYEHSSFGHLILEEEEGVLYAKYQQSELWLKDHIPAIIRENARQDPRRSYSTAIKFDVIEQYLIDLVRDSQP
ncbi:hypothetical protein [Flavobacterium sp. FlaQc-48]|uniref:hypothetical protein n=1 Tax=Flavobacterium sp. FlaQc-48 TaxID=3374181 RepID=UPI0037583704